ncbi:MAG TPA: putative ABC transporter permease [Spirochaetota bacterium]|nr:putative ABC transporter permease [Spirochaetota bacterium]
MIQKEISTLFITPQLILYFFPIYAFLGWLGEVIYRTITRKQFVNPGLLSGPVLPLYGSASIIIIFIASLFPINNPVFDFIFFAIFCSIIEYMAAALAENYFKIRLWEYDDYRFNLKGRICLRFAIYWGLYTLVFLYIIHPFFYNTFEYITKDVYPEKEHSITLVLIFINAAIVLDFMISAKAMKKFIITLNKFIENYITLENEQIQQYLYKMRKPLKSFRAIRKYTDFEIRKRLKKNISDQLIGLKQLMSDKLFIKKSSEEEFKSKRLILPIFT